MDLFQSFNTTRALFTELAGIQVVDMYLLLEGKQGLFDPSTVLNMRPKNTNTNEAEEYMTSRKRCGCGL